MKKNFIYQSAYQLTTMILPIVTVPIVTRAFSAKGIGEWNYIFSIVSYFILIAGLGLSNYATKEISIVSDDKEKLSEKFWEIEIFNCLFVALTLVIYFFLTIYFFPYKKYFRVMTIALIGSFFDVSWFFLGISDFKKISILNIAIKLFSFFSVIVFIQKRSDFSTYIWIQSLTIFVSQFVFTMFLRKHIVFFMPSKKNILKHFKPALSYFIGKVGSNLFMNINKTILGYFSAMQLLGIYSNSLIFVSMSGGVLNSLNVVMIPYMSKIVYSEKDGKESERVFSNSLHFQIYLAIAMMFGILTINNSVIPWFFGDGFEQMENVVPIMSTSIVLQAFYNTVATQYLIPHNKMRFYNISLISGLIVTLVLSLISVPVLGLFGAVYAYLIGQLFVCIMRYSYLKRNTKFKFKKKIILLFVASGIIMYTIATKMTIGLDDNPITTGMQIIIGASVYIGLTYKAYIEKMMW